MILSNTFLVTRKELGTLVAVHTEMSTNFLRVSTQTRRTLCAAAI